MKRASFRSSSFDWRKYANRVLFRLIYRPEYWVISKDVAHGPILGDEIEFHLSHNGELLALD